MSQSPAVMVEGWGTWDSGSSRELRLRDLIRSELGLSGLLGVRDTRSLAGGFVAGA
jgi:hypothetical protein